MSEKKPKKHRKRINRCVECKEPLKSIGNNRWMCDQAPAKCNFSAKVTWLSKSEDLEEE
jgi:hypothetical protein